MQRIVVICLGMLVLPAADGLAWAEQLRGSIRFATFNTALHRAAEGQLAADLAAAGDPQAEAIAEIIQRVDPHVILINEFDYDPQGTAAEYFRENYLAVGHHGALPVVYPFVFQGPTNTGIDSGFDLNHDGRLGGPDDAFGYGSFPGQYGMLLLSKFPILSQQVRTFRGFLWKDMPAAQLPDDPQTPATHDWYGPDELEVLRLSSKSHWDVPLDIGGRTIHILASHPTPPVFDGLEDRNGARNHDEIRFWLDYITPGGGDYIYDDQGVPGGRAPDEAFVILGDLNADPVDGDGRREAIIALLQSPQLNTAVVPGSEGGREASLRQGGVNSGQLGDPARDTGDFYDGPSGAGNLRTDYVLPSDELIVRDAGIFWPTSEDPLFRLVGDGGSISSDHRLVFVDVAVIPEPSTSGLLMAGFLLAVGARWARYRKRSRCPLQSSAT